jgi:hypothetical protein
MERTLQLIQMISIAKLHQDLILLPAIMAPVESSLDDCWRNQLHDDKRKAIRDQIEGNIRNLRTDVSTAWLHNLRVLSYRLEEHLYRSAKDISE